LDGFEARWQREVAEILAGVKEWRLRHPKATFAEIEAALDSRWLAARAGLLGDLASASRAADLGGVPAGERARCPACGKELAPRGKHGRSVLTTGGEAVALEREYAACPSCGAGLFPPGRRA
jgi:ribosomal protein S27AE